ncbi:MAG: hypothetical protein IJF05_04095 [Clostridia bacterium]|nr:hypothetical protein [Clostridia bacterium]
MKKITAFLLCILICFYSLTALTACKEASQPVGGDTPTPTPTPSTPTPEPEPQGPTIAVPNYKDFGRDTVNFTEIVYESPDVEDLIEDFNSATARISANELPFDEQLEGILALEDGYNAYLTMYTLAEINNSRDSSNEFWLEEYTYLSTNSSAFSQAVEDLYVAAAQSPHKSDFEEEYFGVSLDDYVDGGVYTDELVALLTAESELIARYNGFSTDTVIITVNGEEGTVKQLMDGVPASKYDSTLNLYMLYYMNEVTRLTKGIYLELVRTRIEIAEELGKESYIEVAYEEMGHDYSPEKTLSFLSDVKNAAEIAYRLYYNNFYHLSTDIEPYATKIDVINTLYALFGEINGELGDIYAYMLQHGLYDYSSKADNRLDGAFTTYIRTNNSPFIFMTASGRYSDYVTLSHEFGHFADMYTNYGRNAGLDLSEVYSQALAYLMLLKIEDSMSETQTLKNNYRYMLHKEMDEIYNILAYQGYLATFEHMVYSLSSEEVTEDKLLELMDEAQIFCLGGVIPDLSSWDAVLIVHTVEYPFYVQSYCTSLVAAIEIMLMEIEQEGAGIAAYMSLLNRDNDNPLSFEEELERASISSPLRDGAILDMYQGVYRFITGKVYSR